MPNWMTNFALILFILLVIILLLRPQGLFGQAEGRKQ